MKSRNRLAVFSAVLILVASISMVSYLGVNTANAKSSYSFTLNVSGKAYDTHQHAWVNVDFSVTGSASGNLKTVIDLNVKGGDVNVQNYGAYPVSQACGEVINSCHYTCFCCWITSTYYGGKFKLCCQWGRTGKLTGKTLSLSLCSDYLILPGSGTPVLKDCSLTGTLGPVE
jgi:hypothetical protein